MRAVALNYLSTSPGTDHYAWLAEPKSAREKEDQRLLGLIKHAWLESGGVYGYRKIHDDLRELGESCGQHRVARLMQVEGLRSQTGYRRRPGYYGGKPTVASPNRLERQFNVSEPNKGLGHRYHLHPHL